MMPRNVSNGKTVVTAFAFFLSRCPRQCGVWGSAPRFWFEMFSSTNLKQFEHYPIKFVGATQGYSSHALEGSNAYNSIRFETMCEYPVPPTIWNCRATYWWTKRHASAIPQMSARQTNHADKNSTSLEDSWVAT